ncbi:hypothetical protein DACRYDRAFT_22023 [Dacryopinax primogenitus]|uniref:non-specific serine/threonine protein kinase n=1 Tax=Dacryopinax primogenitus (strain DJM 731) TaxID=1858805 RepID=M5G0S8_DACPD|nr:uncharacterized protein DACRYDRAFT_22023 [Dacryopinax primogenitus]EJU02349.1 hypothetical protein DACRYDRAFT_22023 [Dacryopinax primogenitus]
MLFVGRPIAQKLTRTLNLDLLVNEDYLKEVSWFFQCIRRGITKLKTYYAQLRRVDEPFDENFYPVHTQIAIKKDSVDFIAKIQYDGWPEINEDNLGTRPVFSGIMTVEGQEPEACIIKFVDLYGIAVQEHIVTTLGAAPKIYGVQRLSPTLQMVVMEKIADGERLIELGHVTEQRWNNIKAQLRELAEVLKAANFVHGDIRSPNILLTPDDRVKLIDFDTAGKEGEVFYPANINMMIDWPEGVGPGKLIRTVHDQVMIARLADFNFS